MAQHPWFSRKIRKAIWNLIERTRKKPFLFHSVDHDLKIFLNPQDDSVGKHIFLSSYEKETISFIKKYLNYGDTAVDIGANIGYFSLIFSNLVGETGRVHSFEPSQREFYHLCENIRINRTKNIFPNQLAIGNENGFLQMNVLRDSKFGAYNSFSEITHPKVNKQEVQTEIVRVVRLDDYFDLFSEKVPQLIKVDVEGFEKQVLEGMQKLLVADGAPCLIIEMCESTHQSKENDIQNLITSIESFGYKLFNIIRDGNIAPFQIGASLNSVAIKDSKINSFNTREVRVVD